MKEKTQNGQFQADKHDFSYLDPDQQAKSYFVLQKKFCIYKSCIRKCQSHLESDIQFNKLELPICFRT